MPQKTIKAYIHDIKWDTDKDDQPVINIIASPHNETKVGDVREFFRIGHSAGKVITLTVEQADKEGETDE